MDSNRTQIALVREVTLGSVPGTPRMRKVRATGEGLTFRPDFEQSEELRSDRMNADPILVGQSNAGPVNIEWSFPVDLSPLSEIIRSAFQADWTNAPFRDNDGTADSVITAVATTNTILTVTTGAAFVAGHLCRFTGFGVAGNNGVFKCTTGSATVPRFVGSGITDEAAPPAAARVKVVGFEGADADITATATGLGSTALDFTTLGLTVGQWVKIGGTGAAYRFANEDLNDWARVTAIAATALTLDNLPAAWTTNAGTGKTIRVFFGDVIKNGTTIYGVTLERGFLAQGTPTYVVQSGMAVNRLTCQITAKRKLTGAADFLGMSGSESTTALDASPDAAPSVASYPVMAASANVGRIAENGSALGSPNWARELTIEINNNLRALDAVGSMAPVNIGAGSCDVMINLNTYFGSRALYTKLLAGTATNLNSRLTKNNQAIIWGLPRLTATEGSPNAQGKNQDVTLPLRLTASIDDTTSAHIILDRFEYVQS